MERDIIIVNAAKLLVMMLLLEKVALLYIETKEYAMPKMKNFNIFFALHVFATLCNKYLVSATFHHVCTDLVSDELYELDQYKDYDYGYKEHIGSEPLVPVSDC